MKTIKNMLKSISEYFTRVSSRFPLTLVLIILTSLSAALFIDQSGEFADFMESKGLLFLFISAIGAFFGESLCGQKKALRWCTAAAAALSGVGLVCFYFYGSDPVKVIAGRCTAVYGIALTALGTWFNFRRSGQPFSHWCIRLVYELACLAIICSITSTGLGLVTAVFAALILNGQHFMLIFRINFLVIGCLAGSGILDAQISPERERARFFSAIVKNLLGGLLIAAFVIVYGYILKIIITRVVPSNEIFRILAGLFIIGLPIWTLIGTFEENELPVRIGVKLPYLFIPFLFLQGYAIRERIAAYGLTPMRYLCLVLMVFEVLYILVYALRKRETGVMLPVIAIMAAVSLALPYVNMYSTAVRSQKAIFDRYITADFSDLSPEEQNQLTGAYYYLADDPEGKAAVSDTDPAKLAAIEGSGLTGVPGAEKTVSVSREFTLQDADISAYNSMTAVSTWSSRSEYEAPELFDREAVAFYDPEGSELLTADLSGFIAECIAASGKGLNGSDAISGAVQLDDGRMILVRSCSFVIEEEEAIRHLYVEGLLLENVQRD